MGGLKVKRNEFPKVIAAMPREIGDGVDDFGDILVEALLPRVWFRTGVLKTTVAEREKGRFHVTVGVGFNPRRYGGNPRGFYAAYQEFGTRYQAPRPVVGPTSHALEPVYVRVMTDAVRKACRV